MAFPDKLMTRDEQIVEHLHPHWITLVPATLWLVLICVASGVGIAFAPHGSANLVVVLVIVVAALVLLSWLTFAPWIRWRTTHYVITTQRVLIRRGVLRHAGRDIGLARINDVGFVLTLWDRLVGAGTLTIESAGDLGQEKLVNVPHAERVQQTINHLVDVDSQRNYRGRDWDPNAPR